MEYNAITDQQLAVALFEAESRVARGVGSPQEVAAIVREAQHRGLHFVSKYPVARPPS